MKGEWTLKQIDADILRRDIKRSMALGQGLIVLGLVAAAAPFPAFIGIGNTLGGLLAVAGAIHFMHAFQSRKTVRTLVEFAIALLCMAAGARLLAHPLGEKIALPFFFSTFLLVEGGFKLVLGLQLRPFSNWMWHILSGEVAVILGLSIWAVLPVVGLRAVVLMAGADFVFGGASMLMTTIWMRDALEAGRPFCVQTTCFHY